MRLVVHLVLRLVGVVLLCLACAVGWILIDTHRAIERETVASADRAARALQNLYWQELIWRDGILMKGLIPLPEWRSLETLRVVSPGVCITFAPGMEEPRRLCTQTDEVGSPAPDWFAGAYDALLGAYPAVTRPLTQRQPNAGTIVVSADPATAAGQAWRQVRIVAGVAAAMAVGIAVLAALLIGHALRPADAIIDGLRRLEQGDHAHPLPHFPTREFSHIARAVNDLASRLARTTAERLALTQRLFQVQESERRALARDLHDEFGQCLTGTAALAAAIESGAADRPELAEDARAIARITAGMMAILRGALVRLRSQELEELGLEASLAQLVAGWNTRAAPHSVFHLDVAGDLASVPSEVAVNLYRIAQECLTNAARHGRPSDVRLRVERLGIGDQAVALTVEDDGGGAPTAITASGHGILGIRERVAALGGRLSIEPAMRGLRVAAIIPLLSPSSPSAAAPGYA
jgi:two-component system, NarL family, sensor histidine kinase UhpB